MVISHKNKYIYIATPKTGTTSIQKLLVDNYDGEKDFTGLSDGKHCGAKYALRNHNKAGFFSFSFVRNPWDRLVSWYGMLQRNFPNYNHSFGEFLRYTCGLIDSEIYSNMGKMHNMSQERWCDAVDFVGRYENLDADLNKVFAHLELPAVQASQLPQKNVSKHRNYVKGYYTDFLKDMVAEKCAWEIDKFGYKFGE